MAKELQSTIVATLQAAEKEPSALMKLRITSSTSDARTIADLCHNAPFEIIEDNSRWNLHPKFMMEIIGNMTPDIVVRSKGSSQNRILIEVKETAPLNYGMHDSQMIRYFLHLLATSSHDPSSNPDIRRAVLLAAPNKWFEANTGTAWTYFLNRYTDLARAFDVTLGELRLA